MPVLNEDQQAQILTPSVLRLMQVLDGNLRAVGGAVRDVLLGRKVGDIDLATPWTPTRVTAALQNSHIKAVPTGLAHGTITAVVDHVGYEITTLRRDVETDGRHARVAFTDDWREDAARRDFTLNALYVDAAGNLYDYFNGTEDACAGRVRFIGDAKARIREDVLRILRFFRFYAFFGQGPADPEALAACRELAPLIPKLSMERIAREVVKLLTAENPLPALGLMRDCGVTPYFLPEVGGLSRIEALIETETRLHASISPWIRFAALLPEDEAVAAKVAARLKLSKHDTETLCVLAKLPTLMAPKLSQLCVRQFLYDFGTNHCRAALLLIGGDIAGALETVAAWEAPVFPLSGKDIVKLGLPAGPHIGILLRAVEGWWRRGDFRADREACLVIARDMGNNP